MIPRKPTRALSLAALILTIGACSDITNVSAPDLVPPDGRLPNASGASMMLVCAASTEFRTVNCEPGTDGSSFGAPGGPRAAIIGGQDLYMSLTSSNVAVVADTFAFDVSVASLIPQPVGTVTGAPDPDGVRVFFNSEPSSAGAGTVTVANADGVGTFTASAQPYYQYDVILEQGTPSSSRRWKLQFSPEVTDFTFTVYVSGAVPYPNGYVDGIPYVLTLNPEEVRTLPGSVRNVVGVEQTDETIDWTTGNATLAAIEGTQVTAGSSRGVTTLTAISGIRPAIYPTTVSVCEATVVTDGTLLPSSISSTDCFSSYGSNSGTPSTSYYADLYRVTLTAGQTITITLDTDDDLDTYLLLAPLEQGILVAQNDDDDEGALGVGSRIDYTATESGVYVIEASTFNGLDTGDYVLGVSIS